MSPRRERPLQRGTVAPAPAHNRQKLPATRSASGAHRPENDLSDPHAEPPEEPGAPVEATERGLQFLRDATEQYNFESDLRSEVDDEFAGAPVGQIVSEATLEAAQQGDFELPVSAALSDDPPEVTAEPDAPVVDLTSNAIVAASLFDRPIDASEEQDELEAETEDDVAAPFAAPLRQPRVTSDDPSDVDAAKQAEIQRLLDERVKRRLRVSELPKAAAGRGRASRARAAQTAHRAASIVCETTGLDDHVMALAALETVAGGLVRRVTAAEASDFIAQLPSELHDSLLDLPAGPDENVTTEAIHVELAKRLDLEMAEAATLARGVGEALRRLVSAGELEDMLSQLPSDMRALLEDRS
jgi:uncharacterized protein (DUF2267 family)